MNRALIVAGAVVMMAGCVLSPESWIIDDLPNPGRGWETFHSFESDARNSRYPVSAVAYFRFRWAEIEPAPGEYGFGVIDDVLERAASEGQTVAFRIMPDCSDCDGSQLGVPQWLIDEGVAGVWYGDGAFMPDFADPVYLEHAEQTIRALGARYNGDRRVEHVDIGFVGHWGEWHVSDAEDAGATMPPLDVRKRYIDWHLEAFPDTPVLMLVGDSDPAGAEALRYAVENGAGWRADCWGDYGRGWNHMEDFYPVRLSDAQAGDAWKTAPVALETCGVPSTWLLLFPGRIDEILQFAVDNHVSLLNGKSDSIPAVWRDRFASFTSQIGYRFVLDSVVAPASASPGSTVSIVSRWSNAGNAPVYRDYTVGLRLTNGTETSASTSAANLRSWLPGSGHEAAVDITIPADFPAGDYQLQAAILDDLGEPAIQFLHEGDAPIRAWVTLSTIMIE